VLSGAFSFADFLQIAEGDPHGRGHVLQGEVLLVGGGVARRETAFAELLEHNIC
jgi:hypothetical protein